MTILTRLLRRLSIRGLALLSVCMALAPLLIGLGSAFFAIDRLSVQSRNILSAMDRDLNGLTELQTRLHDFERKGWNFLGSGNFVALAEFRSAHERLGESLSGLGDSLQSDDRRAGSTLGMLATEEKSLFDSILSRYPPIAEGPNQRPHEVPEAVRELAPIGDWFQSLRAKTAELSQAYAAQFEKENSRLDGMRREFRYRLIFGFGMLFAISSALLAILFYWQQHPVRQIDHVIRALAAGNFSRPVRVVGTGDMEYLGERLEWLRRRLNDLELAKQRFVRNVSHEIKTPLATIHEGTNLLLDEVVGELNEEQRHIAAILAGNTDKLDNLVNELINYSQLSARMEQQKLTLVNMRELVLNLLEEYQLQLRSKSIKVVKHLESLEIMGNREQLRTLVDNLLSNAVKYSPSEGEIRLSLQKKGGHMEFDVEDDGPGVEPHERPRVFEPFFRGRAARELDIKGTGFGLAIVAECVNSHHGKVEVLESQNGDAGALFRVQIPMQSFGNLTSVIEDQ